MECFNDLLTFVWKWNEVIVIVVWRGYTTRTFIFLFDSPINVVFRKKNSRTQGNHRENTSNFILIECSNPDEIFYSSRKFTN